jgi:hypothetical protein
MFILHELADGNAEAQLNTFAKTVNCTGDDERIDILCASSNDYPNKAHAIGSDEEPAASSDYQLDIPSELP